MGGISVQGSMFLILERYTESKALVRLTERM